MDTPAAITVLGHDEIQRSGATTLVDALRMVPGMNVAALSSSQSAVSARGFNGVFSNKMLVQIDGRTIYQPIFAGVFWDLQQQMLDDVERIEVIRGPGASVWGANAVNGVISVVSRSARDTQGGLFYQSFGDIHELMTGARYGGKLGENTYYRVFGSYREEDDFLLPTGRSAGDGWTGMHGGFRIDHYQDADTHLTWQADGSGVDFDDGTADAYNVNSLLRWTRQLGERSHLEVLAFYDRVRRDEGFRARGSTDSFDVSAQHLVGVGDSHDVLWGVGYRYSRSELEQANPLLVVRRGGFDLNLFSAFVQDEFTVVPDRFTLTSGLKIEHNDYTGLEFQPSVRALFTPSGNQSLWAAVSRAVRTPNAVEGKDVFGLVAGAPFVGPGGTLYLPQITGDGDPHSEVLWAYEMGYRLRATDWMSWSVAGFYNHYSDLIAPGGETTFQAGAPLGTADQALINQGGGSTYGGETTLTVTPTESWRLAGTYSLLLADVPLFAPQPRSFPTQQVMLRSSHDLTEKATLDLQLRYVDQSPSVPSYVTADFRLAYRPRPDLELSVVGQNLFDSQHPEISDQPLTPSYEVPRGFYGKITWNF